MAILTRKVKAAKAASARNEEIRAKRTALAEKLKTLGLTSARYVAPDFLLTASDAEEVLGALEYLKGREA